MHFTETFIRRPVLSTVLGAFILLLGVYGILNLPVRQYPEVEETVVTITTVYPGAPPDLIQGFITSPIAQAVATTENIDYLTSQSTPSVSVVSVNMELGSDPDVALTEVLSKVQQVRGQLPEEAEDPVIVKGTGMDFALMYLIALNPNMTQEQITEYLERVIRPRMSTIPGVAEIEIIGAANYAMRVWLDPLQLAARNVTATDVRAAIAASNFLSAPGKTENEFVAYNITMQSTLQTPEAFGALPLRGEGDAVVRLRDVARVELASEEQQEIVTFNGESGTFIGVFPTPAANPLDTADAVVAELPAINASLPQGMEISLVYDSTEQITASIEEVYKTIAEAVAIVVVVILLFLGSFRSVLMPIVTIPLSPDRRLRAAAGDGLLDQPPVAPGDGAGDRPRRRRRHRRRREHPPPYRGGPRADRRRDRRHEGDHRPGDRDDADARRGAGAARLHRRPDRGAVPASSPSRSPARSSSRASWR